MYRTIYKIQTSIILITVYLVCLSCEDGFDYNNNTKQIVLNCLFTPSDTVLVNTTWTMSLKEDVLVPVTGADISISNDGENYFTLIPEEVEHAPSNIVFTREGYYYLPQQIVRPGDLCSLNLSHEGHILKAYDVVPYAVPIDSLDYTHYLIFDETIPDPVLSATSTIVHFEGTLFVTDPEETNYYALALNTNCNGFKRTYQQFSCKSPYVESLIKGLSNFQMIFSDKLFNGEQITMKISTDYQVNQYPADSVSFEVCLLSVSENYYKYASSFYKQVVADKDFYAEPSPVFSNIEGGRGIFAAYSRSSKSVTLKVSRD